MSERDTAENDVPDWFGHMADLDRRVAAFNAAYCRPYGPLTERDTAYWDPATRVIPPARGTDE